MSFIYIDRRKAGKGKSSQNRQKLIKRVREFVKTSSPHAIGKSGVGGVTSSHGSKIANNPVTVAGDALEEPFFAYAKSGDQTTIYLGNTEYDRGDEINIEEEAGGQPQGGPGENGEDDFIINVASDEFLDLFFEDCELPNLMNEKVTEKVDTKQQHAGFSSQGNPSQLSVIRTFKQSLGRQWALGAPLEDEIEKLEEELKVLLDMLVEIPFKKSKLTAEAIEGINNRIDVIEKELSRLYTELDLTQDFDKVDLRYRKKEAKPLHTVDAVLILIMDISGSMDQDKKTIARRWFALLYAFIKRRYPDTDLVFIAHTEEAFEMSENDFFSTRINGGTMVSPALVKANEIIKSRYDPSQTNIYISHASDGDNWTSDNDAVVQQMIGPPNLMSKIQFFNYVEVGTPWAWNAGTDTNLWQSYMKVHDKLPKKTALALIKEAEDCYAVFKKIFAK